MRVFAILGGLGSQMFKYAFCIAVKSKVDDDCLIDTSFFSKPRKGSWNGYELEDIFGIHAPDIHDMMNNKNGTEATDWYPMAAISHMSTGGGVVYYNRGIPLLYPQSYPNLGRWQQLSLLYEKIKRRLVWKQRIKLMDKFGDEYPDGFLNAPQIYVDEFDHRSDKYFKECKKMIKQQFTFPPFDEARNIDVARRMNAPDSVAVHVRRSDHMYDNGNLFTTHYFQRAVHLIKNKTNEEYRTFYLFSDDIEWCMSNLSVLGLEDTDKIAIVDWNKGKDSFRDMQLMTHCQHNIIPISSFSWWGYYLSDRENKIVCAPQNYWTEVPYHF